MTKPLTNRQITNRWVGAFQKHETLGGDMSSLVDAMTEALKEKYPAMSPKDRHAIVLNTITRYVRYLLTEEEKSND